MNKMLEKAFAEAAKLSEAEQDELAQWLLQKIASEQRWQEAISTSHERLVSLAEEALTEHREGRTQELDLVASQDDACGG